MRIKFAHFRSLGRRYRGAPYAGRYVSKMRSATLIIFLLALVGSSIAATAEVKMTIDPLSVEVIEIKKRGADATRKLSPSEVLVFAIAWNEATSIGLCKFAFEYRIELRHKSGQKTSYRTNGKNIKAENDYCFSVRDDSTFKNLWGKSDD